MTPVDAPQMRRLFCARLKSERERQGTSLATIADTTKLKVSLLEALERGDVSRWPKGIYRKAFFREYVAAIGLPPEPHLGEFLDLFPDGEERPAAQPIASTAARQAPAPFRLNFALDERKDGAPRFGLGTWPDRKALGRQALAATLDLALVLILAALAFLSLTAPFGLAALIVGGVYFSLGTVLAGCSPMAWWIRPRTHASGAPTAASAPTSASSSVTAPVHATARAEDRPPAGAVARGTAALRSYLGTPTLPAARRGPTLTPDLADVRRRRVEHAGRNGVDEVAIN